MAEEIKKKDNFILLW